VKSDATLAVIGGFGAIAFAALAAVAPDARRWGYVALALICAAATIAGYRRLRARQRRLTEEKNR
jgi:hypothetical protein